MLAGRGAGKDTQSNEVRASGNAGYLVEENNGSSCKANHHLIDIEAVPEQCYQLVTGLIAEDLLYTLALNIHRLPFEARKDVQTIFSYVLRFRPATASPKSDPLALSYVINNRPEVLIALCNGYNHKESVVVAGTVLREVLKHESAAAIILYDDGEGNSSTKGLSGVHPEIPQTGKGVFWKFFDWIDKSTFEVGADAFTTFRVHSIPAPCITFN